jgi:hypothetical protein
MLRAFTFGIALFCSLPAGAASIDVTPLKDSPNEALIVINGELHSADVENFRTKVAPFSKGVVVLSSPGGSALAGVEIGRLIRLRGFKTWVLSGFRCESACAIAWLGGSPRFMGRDALVGFHAAYKLEDGRPQETGAGNALVGGYLSQLGLSDRAIVYVTSTAPTSMTYLTAEDARRADIEVGLLDPDDKEQRKAATPAPPATASRSPVPSISDRSLTFVRVINDSMSEANSKTLQVLMGVYASTVRYYGKDVSKEDVLAQVARFLERWPARKYQVKPGSVTVDCDDVSMRCTVRGVIEFDARSAARSQRSSGTASFEYLLQYTAGQVVPVILAESGALIDRRMEPLALGGGAVGGYVPGYGAPK